MKFTLALLGLVFSVSASADPACTALTSVVGKYELVAKQCINPHDGVVDLEVRNENGSISIWAGNVGIGPSTSPNASDKCTVEANRIIVQTCYNSTSCLPQHWYYTFTADGAEHQRNGCTYQFKKIN